MTAASPRPCSASGLAPWQAEPYRLWSLLDMISLDTHAALAAVDNLAGASNVIAGCVERKRLPADFKEVLGPVILDALEAIQSTSERLGFIVDAQQSLDLCREILGHARLDDEDYENILYSIRSTGGAFIKQMSAQIILAVEPKHVPFFQPKNPLFGDGVHNAFESSRYDIEEAGKCIGVGRWTACVVHLMRAFDPLVKHLNIEAQLKDPKQNWGDIINRVKGKFGSPNAPSDKQWLAESASYFDSVKDAWRNHACHGSDKYDEELFYAISVISGATVRGPVPTGSEAIAR